MNRYGFYALGMLFLVGGLIATALLLNVPGQWVAVGALVLIGLFIIGGALKVRGTPRNNTTVVR